MSVSSAALRSASGSKPPCFLIARGSTSDKKIQAWLKPIETCGGTSRARLGLVALDHLGGEVRDARLQGLWIEQLRRDRIDVVEIIHVLAEGLDQLVDLSVARAVSDHRGKLQAGLLRLAQEQRDVRIVARVQDHIGLRA